MNVTVDANVFVAAARSSEANHAASEAFLERLHGRGDSVICPLLVLPECAAAVARATLEESAAMRLVRSVESYPGIALRPLDLVVARRAAEMGADAVYCAVAERSGATLVTWDAEMRERAAGALNAMTPAEWMAAWGAAP